MNRLVVSAVVSAALLGSGCGKSRSEVRVRGRVNHIVLCWLKEPANRNHRERILEVSRTFREIPGVLEVRAGEVVPSERQIADDSFDVAVCLTFASTRDMNAYLEHPRHKAAVKDVLLPVVERIVVYDFVE